jgi:hypothetical protein
MKNSKIILSILTTIVLVLLSATISFAAPKVTWVGCDLFSGIMTFTGVELESVTGVNNDIDLSKLIITNGGRSYQFKSRKVEITNDTSFSISLAKKEVTDLQLILDTENEPEYDEIYECYITKYNVIFAPGWNGKNSKVVTCMLYAGSDLPSIDYIEYHSNLKEIWVHTQNVKRKTGYNCEINPSRFIITDMKDIFIRLSASGGKIPLDQQSPDWGNGTGCEAICIPLKKSELDILDTLKINDRLKVIVLDGWSTPYSLGYSDTESNRHHYSLSICPDLNVSSHFYPNILTLEHSSLVPQIELTEPTQTELNNPLYIQGEITVGGVIKVDIDTRGDIYLVPAKYSTIGTTTQVSVNADYSKEELDAMIASKTGIKVSDDSVHNNGSIKTVSIPTTSLQMETDCETYCILGAAKSGETFYNKELRTIDTPVFSGTTVIGVIVTGTVTYVQPPPDPVTYTILNKKLPATMSASLMKQALVPGYCQQYIIKYSIPEGHSAHYYMTDEKFADMYFPRTKESSIGFGTTCAENDVIYPEIGYSVYLLEVDENDRFIKYKKVK